MRPAIALFLVVAALGVAGCGSSHARRDAVNAYFQKVDRAQQGLLASTGEIDAAFQSFSLATNKPGEQRELEFARGRLGSRLCSVGAIERPPDARVVHRALVGLLALQLAVARELVWTVTYEPRFSRALEPLPAASRKLAREIALVGKPASKAPKVPA